MHPDTDDQEIREAMTRYIQDIQVPRLNIHLQANQRYLPKRTITWASLAVAVVLAVAFASTDDVVAFYQQVFVRERSQPVAGIELVLQRAPFQVWVPEGELIEVQELGSDGAYAVITKYSWGGTKEIVIMQDTGTSIPPSSHTAFWEGARNVDDTITIQGQPAVIYETPVTSEQGTILRWSRKLYVILNGTAIVIFEAHSPALSHEELIAIGESLRPCAIGHCNFGH